MPLPSWILNSCKSQKNNPFRVANGHHLSCSSPKLLSSSNNHGIHYPRHVEFNCSFQLRVDQGYLRTLSNSTNIILFILGCNSCFEPRYSQALQTPVDLQTNGSKTTCINSGQYQSCTLHGEFFDYNDFQPRWENISDIFSLNATNQKFSIEVSVYQTFY